MKKTAMMVVLALVVAVMMPVMANETAKMMKNTHDVSVWFVSADAKTNMMTIKDDKGEQKTVPVMGAAVKEMSNLKAGQKIMVSCMDDDKGNHQGITAIKTEMAKK